MADLIQIRRDTKANWSDANPVLALGEPGLETDTRRVKYGDGVTAWNSLPYAAGGEITPSQFTELQDKVTELDETAVRTGSYDGTVAVGLADNLRGDSIVDAEFYKRKTGGTQSVGSGIAAIKEVRGNSIVWNQQIACPTKTTNCYGVDITWNSVDNTITLNGTATGTGFQDGDFYYGATLKIEVIASHKYLAKYVISKAVNITIESNTATSTAPPLSSEGVVFSPNRNYSNVKYTVGVVEGQVYDNIVVQIMVIDLTLMFGAGNEPATVEEFEKMFPLDYYDYNAGEVIPFAGQNLVTTGFNQWDEQWERGVYNTVSGEKLSNNSQIRTKNYIPILSNKEYYCYIGKTASMWVLFYDGDHNLITGYDAHGVEIFENANSVQNHTFITPQNAAYMRFYLTVGYGSTYNNDICINISDPDRNGTYEPYEKHTLPLDPSQWRDKNGNLVFPYGGMHGVGTAYDYAKVDADGYIRKAVRCFGQVDLGSLNWVYENKVFDGNGVYGKQTYYNLPNFICYKYIVSTGIGINIKDMCIGGQFNNRILVKDSSYTDATSFKAAMQGVPLIYELATPVEVELATPIYAKYLADKDGTEEITPANGAEPYTTPANLSILYAMDARGEIKNLPKNYLSKESAENMLNAMKSAGVISNYTMTYSNGQYVFTFVKAQQASTNAYNNELNI